MAEIKKRKRRMTPFQTIILGFAGVILLGGILLMFPFASNSGEYTPFNQSLFTSVSATCVTGLIVKDTATHWSVYGKAIILVLIQIGGLGVISVGASFAILAGRKSSLAQRSTMQEAIAGQKIGGIEKLVSFSIKGTLLIEFIGAAVMMPVFVSKYGNRGIGMSIFHAVSATCNAGFDVMGTTKSKFASITAFTGHPLINIVIMLLIISGGIGFLTWEDIYIHKFRIKRYRMQSKVVLVVSGILILVPSVFFFFVDFTEFPMKDRILASLFQAVSPRTAGFNTVNLTQMSTASRGIVIVLMLIGGSPGSTAGGMKTTTFAVLISNAIACFRRKEDATFFGRRINSVVVKNASTILVMYIGLFLTGALVISVHENIPLTTCLYETASAVGTVGLTLGITPKLSLLSQIVLMGLMYFGRVGGLTLIYATLSRGQKNLSKLPLEKITVG